jgi:hypothetical protein
MEIIQSPNHKIVGVMMPLRLYLTTTPLSRKKRVLIFHLPHPAKWVPVSPYFSPFPLAKTRFLGLLL